MPENLVEVLITLFIFVVLPLLQWLRERGQRRPESQIPGEGPRPTPPRPRPRPTPAPPEAQTPMPRPRERTAPPRRAERPRPQRPAATDRAAEPVLPREGPVAPIVPAVVVVPPQVVRRRALVRALRDRTTVRRAMIFATILGPCRALAPHGGDRHR